MVYIVKKIFKTFFQQLYLVVSEFWLPKKISLSEFRLQI